MSRRKGGNYPGARPEVVIPKAPPPRGKRTTITLNVVVEGFTDRGKQWTRFPVLANQATAAAAKRAIVDALRGRAQYTAQLVVDVYEESEGDA